MCLRGEAKPRPETQAQASMLGIFCGLPLLGYALMNSVSYVAARSIALWVTTLVSLCSIGLWWSYDASGLGLGLRSASWLLLLGTILFPLCVLCVNDRRALGSVLLLEVLVNGSVLCMDAMIFYILFEATTVPLLVLITRGAVWHRVGSTSGSYQAPLRHKSSAAYRMISYTMLGSLLLLPMLLLIYQEQGTMRLTFLWASGVGSSFASELLLWVGFMVVFGIKMPMVPAHLWLPEAHVAAPTAGSVLLSGVFLKLGGFGFVFMSLPLCGAAHVYASPAIATLAFLGVVYGSMATLRQVDLKKMVAYSSIVHMSMLPLMLFSSSEFSITGAMWMMVAHGLVSPAMFVIVGHLFDRHNTEFLAYVASSGALLPVWRTLFFILTLANVAMPLFPDFIAEFFVLMSLFAVHPWHSFVVCSILVLPTAYGFWAYARVTFPGVRIAR
jgi:proton-translocating NADH-quinone oxidoreductase chain M